jgi:ubiquinone/menaquinone biosynthesis C-methylase UbiE
MQPWQNKKIVDNYLANIRNGIPLTEIQFHVVSFLVEKILKNGVDKFIDFGCGSGFLGKRIFDAYPDSTGYFLDYSQPMLDYAQQNLKGKNAEFFTADHGNPNWIQIIPQDTNINLIIAGYTIHYHSDERKREIYKELFEVLSKNGLLIVLEHIESQSELSRYLHDEFFIKSISKINNLSIEKAKEIYYGQHGEGCGSLKYWQCWIYQRRFGLSYYKRF